MELRDERDRKLTRDPFSRRTLLKSAAALAVAHSRSAVAQEGGRMLVYVGTVTPNGKGIHLFEMNSSTGALKPIKVFEDIPSPTWIAFDANKTHLYAVNAVSNYNGMSTGSVSAFAVDEATGDLSLLNTVDSHGAGPTHLSLHPSGKYLFVANYGGGSVAVLPVQSNGELGEATDVKQNEGTVGPTKAVLAPRGSFAISGHDAPHAHMIEPDPAGNYVLASDLGLDKILIWKFDAENGMLMPNDPPSISTVPGAGPRHFAFHPNGRWFYSVNEEDSTMTFSTYDGDNGVLHPQATVSTLPLGYAGTNFDSEILMSTDGAYVYAANRLYNSIATFAIDQATGMHTLVADEWTRGDYPRSMVVDPSGQFMYVMNQRSDNITTYRVQDGGRKLMFTGQFTGVGSPQAMVFKALS